MNERETGPMLPHVQLTDLERIATAEQAIRSLDREVHALRPVPHRIESMEASIQTVKDNLKAVQAGQERAEEGQKAMAGQINTLLKDLKGREEGRQDWAHRQERLLQFVGAVMVVVLGAVIINGFPAMAAAFKTSINALGLVVGVVVVIGLLFIAFRVPPPKK